MNAATGTINIAKDYSRFPAGRFRSDGPFSGERFREDWLVPALGRAQTVQIELDGTAGYGSSFLEEAFGGLIRRHVISKAESMKRVVLVASDASLVTEIQGYMEE